MIRLVAVFAFAASAFAQEPAPFRFAWKPDQKLTYRVVQTTTVNEIAMEEPSKKLQPIVTVTKISVTKVWTVKSVATDGTAVLEMTMTALKQQTTQTVGTDTPSAKTLDSTVPDDAKAMTFLNKPIVTVKIDPQGKVLDVKSEMPGTADRLHADLPFKLQFPKEAVAVNGAFARGIALKIPPPLGTGETLEATQTVTFRGTKDGTAVFATATELKKPLEEAALLPGVAPVLWSGDLFFREKTGTYVGAKLSVKKEVAGHQGEGTKFAYSSEYTEALEDR